MIFASRSLLVLVPAAAAALVLLTPAVATAVDRVTAGPRTGVVESVRVVLPASSRHREGVRLALDGVTDGGVAGGSSRRRGKEAEREDAYRQNYGLGWGSDRVWCP